MSAVTLARDPLLPQPPDVLGRGAALALAVHALLVVALAAGVQWRRSAPETFSAEIWAALPQQAAPRPSAPPTPPAPTPSRPEPPPPQPQPQPQAQPAAPTTDPAPAPPAVRSEADIAIERQRELARQQAEREAAERLRREQEAARLAEEKRAAEVQRRAEEARAAEAKRVAEEKRLAEEKRVAEERRRAQEQRLAEERRLAQEKRLAEAKRRAEEKRQAAALEAQRQENLRRMMGQAGATGAPDAAGSAARDAAPSAAYAGRLVAAIKPNIVLADSLPPTLEAEVEVRASSTGTILSRRLLRSSGNPVWDEAVLRAVDRTAQLPRDTDGRVPPTIVIRFRPE
ncbi:MAG: cell envelope integrity protein TolA [Burkholderiaceae bacterium]|nr:cell envelope integrity protein TolA [Burkholderiaceae bacterium]